jgi:pilus assembly protein CpaB
MNPLRNLFLQISRVPPGLMLIMIVGLAIGVTMLVADVLNKQNQKLVDQQTEISKKLNEKTTVVYALRDIPEGQAIPSEAIEERKIEVSKAPQDSIPSSTLVAGKTAKYGIAANQIVSQHDLAQALAEVGFNAKLKDGFRAVTFPVDNNSGVAGFVTPESRIDIISMVGSGSDTKAAPILSDVEVIAVGQMYQKAASGAAVPTSSVTVAVTPEDGQKLIKAIAASKLYLALRSEKDHSPVATTDVTSLFNKPQQANHDPSSLLSLAPPPLLPKPGDMPDLNSSGSMGQIAPPPRALHEIEIWSASKKDVMTLAN